MRGLLFKTSRRRALWIGTVAAAAVAWCGFAAARVVVGDNDPPNTGMADPVALVHAYDRFASQGGAADVLTLSLSNLRGLSTVAVNAGGQVLVNLAAGSVSSLVQLLPADESFDLWLIDNKPGAGHTTFAEQGDEMIKAGTYVPAPGGQTLSVSLGRSAFASFFPDRAFVVRSGASPLDGFVLTGPSTLFTRLRHRQVRFVDQASVPQGFNPSAGGRREADIARVIADGRRLFVDEKFDGNGRACATCHVEFNNFTVDPAFIATLPSSDPLFVAETNPALATLENADLLRRFGLILVNADGFDPSRGFVFRGAQNVQALANSTVPQDLISGLDFSTNGRNPNPPERLGWGNDGPPLRDFALVAIAQHAPTTMARVPGSDFRVPTDEELDALAAYQLALGRQEDFDLKALELRSEVARRGQELFLDSGNFFEPGHKNCNACHFNGGGTAAFTLNPESPGFPRVDGSPQGFNIASATSANDIPLALMLSLPRDGGFGQVPTVFGSFGNTDDLPDPFGHFEIEEFNSPPLVESADTAPFFHNHAEADLEHAVAFYGSDAFKNSLVPKLMPIEISADANDRDVQAIAALLRVMNALENIRSSIGVAERGRTMSRVADMRDLAHLSLAETIDALEVLSQGAFATQSEPAVRSARIRLQAARAALELAKRLGVRWAIEDLLGVAIEQLRVARDSLANPATLPPSFRK